MHIFHKWPQRWSGPVLMQIGLCKKLSQRKECISCGAVKYRVVSAGTYTVYSKEKAPTHDA